MPPEDALVRVLLGLDRPQKQPLHTRCRVTESLDILAHPRPGTLGQNKQKPDFPPLGTAEHGPESSPPPGIRALMPFRKPPILHTIFHDQDLAVFRQDGVHPRCNRVRGKFIAVSAQSGKCPRLPRLTVDHPDLGSSQGLPRQTQDSPQFVAQNLPDTLGQKQRAFGLVGKSASGHSADTKAGGVQAGNGCFEKAARKKAFGEPPRRALKARRLSRKNQPPPWSGLIAACRRRATPGRGGILHERKAAWGIPETSALLLMVSRLIYSPFSPVPGPFR
jgi:hypothetical protein